MKENEITSGWIDRYHDGELDQEEEALFLDRLSSSPLLRAETDLDERLTRFLADPELIGLMTTIRQVTSKRRKKKPGLGAFLIAASFLGIALAGGWAFRLVNSPGTGRQLIVQEAVHDRSGPTREELQTEQAPGDHKPARSYYHSRPDDRWLGELTDAFTPHPGLEVLTGTLVRSAGRQVISPPPVIVIAAGTDVPFRWKGCEDEDRLILSVLDHEGNTLLVRSCITTAGTFIRTTGFPPGIYYWKVLCGDDLIAVGKMTIRY